MRAESRWRKIKLKNIDTNVAAVASSLAWIADTIFGLCSCDYWRRNMKITRGLTRLDDQTGSASGVYWMVSMYKLILVPNFVYTDLCVVQLQVVHSYRLRLWLVCRFRYALEIMAQCISMSTPNLITTLIHLTFNSHLFRIRLWGECYLLWPYG